MADETAAKRRPIDFTNVKDGGGINPVRMPEGDYSAKVVKVVESEKEDKDNPKVKVPMWNFVFQLTDRVSATYPYYCKLQENQLWKLRNLLIAAGKNVPKKRINVDPNNLVGSVVGITLSDDEYEGKEKSVIDAVFPASELADDAADEDTSEESAEDVDEVPDDDEAPDADLDLDDL